jgi:hypothetical protein
MRRIALLLLAVAVAACAGETTTTGAPLGWGPASATLYSPPAGGGGIVGDWLGCGDASCADPSSSGLRFAADSTVHDLWVIDQEASGLVFCVEDPSYTYAWDGTKLTLYDLDGGFMLACGLSVNDGIAHLSCLGVDDSYFLRVTGRAEEDCPIYYD